MNTVAQNTDLRASFASWTVKKRIRMCGRPAVPNIRARPSEMAETGSFTSAPGAMMAWWLGWTSTAFAKRLTGLKPNCISTRKAMSEAPPSSRPALMICTQVVASIPPKVT